MNKDNYNEMRILIVEDDVTLTTLWNYIIELSVPMAKITWSKTAEAAEIMIYRNLEKNIYFDIIVSDYFLLGQKTGLDLWRTFSDYSGLFLLSSVLDKNKLYRKIQRYPRLSNSE